SARAKQMRLRTLPPLLACVTKTFSPHTIGVELPGSFSGTFHFTFSLALPPHLSGTFFSSQCPWPVGPRHAGQSAAPSAEQAAAISKSDANVRFMVSPV